MKPELAICVRMGPTEVPVIIARTHNAPLMRQAIRSALADARVRARHAARGDVVGVASARQQVDLLAALVESL